MKRYFSIIIFVCMAFVAVQNSFAQKTAIKTNVLSDLTTTMNLGLEFTIAPKWTIDVSAGYNPWTFSDNKKWKHWLVQPEVRYWLCEKFNGHFFGLHAHGGQFNFGNLNTSFKILGTDFSKLKDARFEGWFMGAGVGYGYSWMLSRHWNLGAEIGFGYSYTDYSEFYCPVCSDKRKEDVHHYVGLTKASVSFIYVF